MLQSLKVGFIPGKNLSRIVKDLHEDFHEDLNYCKIFRNLCKDPQGSFIFLQRSLRIFKEPYRIFKDL